MRESLKDGSLLSMGEWIDLKDKIVPLLSVKEWSNKYSKPHTFSYDGKWLITKDSWNEYTKYREGQYQEYRILNSSPLYQNYFNQVKKKKEQETDYRNYLSQAKDRDNIKRSHKCVSPLAVGYGLAVIASASISSDLLSIEKNTRKG